MRRPRSRLGAVTVGGGSQYPSTRIEDAVGYWGKGVNADDVEVEVQLLRNGGVGPRWLHMVLGELDA